MANLQKLREELDAGHPVTGAYSADDSAASEEINAKGDHVARIGLSNQTEHRIEVA